MQGQNGTQQPFFHTVNLESLVIETSKPMN